MAVEQRGTFFAKVLGICSIVYIGFPLFIVPLVVWALGVVMLTVGEKSKESSFGGVGIASVGSLIVLFLSTPVAVRRLYRESESRAYSRDYPYFVCFCICIGNGLLLG
jgi:hypothetical protein